MSAQELDNSFQEPQKLQHYCCCPALTRLMSTARPQQVLQATSSQTVTLKPPQNSRAFLDNHNNLMCRHVPSNLQPSSYTHPLTSRSNCRASLVLHLLCCSRNRRVQPEAGFFSEHGQRVNNNQD